MLCRLQREEKEESQKGKTLSAWPCHSLPHWSQMEPRNRPISALPGANQSLYSCTSVSSSLARLHRHRQRDSPLPPWQDKMKEDSRAARFLDRRSREPALWMVMDCLCARLPPRLILFVRRVPRALLLASKVTGASAREARNHAYSIWFPLVEQGRSNHSEIWGNKRVHIWRIERRRRRRTKENLGFRAWQKGIEDVLLIQNVGEIPIINQRNLGEKY